VSCVTLMANRSDRRFQTLSPRMAARGRQTDQQNEARGNPSRPGLHLTPDKQAGYMTATEFQIASAIQPLTRAGSIYAWRSEVNSNSRYRLVNSQTTTGSSYASRHRDKLQNAIAQQRISDIDWGRWERLGLTGTPRSLLRQSVAMSFVAHEGPSNVVGSVSRPAFESQISRHFV
jgi:hypothetical protein